MPDRLPASRFWTCAVIILATALVACGGAASEEETIRADRQYDLGVGLLQEQNQAGAFQHLLRALELNPDHADAHLVLGNLYLFTGNRAKAEEHLRHVLRIRTRAPEARNSLGVLYIQERRYDDAIRELREATSDILNREVHLAWGNLGWAYLEKGELQQARDALEQSVRSERRFCVGHYRLGQTLVRLEDFERAEEALTAAVEVDVPTCRAFQEAWKLRAEVRARLGHRDDAMSDLERCVELDPRSDAGRACRRLLDEAQ